MKFLNGRVQAFKDLIKCVRLILDERSAAAAPERRYIARGESALAEEAASVRPALLAPSNKALHVLVEHRMRNDPVML